VLALGDRLIVRDAQAVAAVAPLEEETTFRLSEVHAGDRERLAPGRRRRGRGVLHELELQAQLRDVAPRRVRPTQLRVGAVAARDAQAHRVMTPRAPTAPEGLGFFPVAMPEHGGAGTRRCRNTAVPPPGLTHAAHGGTITGVSRVPRSQRFREPRESRRPLTRRRTSPRRSSPPWSRAGRRARPRASSSGRPWRAGGPTRTAIVSTISSGAWRQKTRRTCARRSSQP